MRWIKDLNFKNMYILRAYLLLNVTFICNIVEILEFYNMMIKALLRIQKCSPIWHALICVYLLL